MTRRASIRLASAAAGLMALFATPAAPAAELVLASSAVRQIVMQTLYTAQGRYVLRPGPCAAYLEQPTITINGGRVRIRSRLTAINGIESGRECLGVPLQTWTVVSGQPVARQGVVRLENLRIDDVEDEFAKIVLQAGLGPRLPQAVELDLQAALTDLLHRWGNGLQGTLERLDVQSVEAESDRLGVKFDFRLTAK